MSQRLQLLDTASLYFRAFYGVPDTFRDASGAPVNAIRGLVDMIAKLVGEYQPTHLVACWDNDWRPAWRVALIPSYKAHRVAEVVDVGPDVEVAPDPLEAQIPRIREVLGLLGIPIVGAAEHEADDVIGTLATGASMPVDVVTGDRDLFQLIDDAADVRVISTVRGMSNLEVLTEAPVLAKYGVRPDQYADFATLRGDASDGLPGVAGIGEKTAAALLASFGSLAGVQSAISDASAPMSAGVRAKLAAATDYLAVAPTVVRVARDLPLGFDVATAELAPVTGEARERLLTLADEWNLGGSIARALAVLDARSVNQVAP